MRKVITPVALAVATALVALDQLVKVLAAAGLPGKPIPVIQNLFYLTYVENRGAAFGMFQGGTRVLGLLSLAVSVALLVLLVSGRIREPVWNWCLTLILAGGAGNCIDRFARGFVVDYFDFSALFGFPVFNLADCCVVCGTIILLASVFAAERKKEAAPAAKETVDDIPQDSGGSHGDDDA